MPASVYRITLGAVFLLSAVQKLYGYATGAGNAAVLPILRDPVWVWALVALDCVIAGACFASRRTAPAAAWVAITLVVGGNFVFLHGIKTAQVSSCGCFGPVPLDATQHVALAICVFYLAARAVLVGRGRSGPAAPSTA